VPAGWRVHYKEVVVKGQSQSEDVFTHGDQTVIAQDEAG
jgi:hypothetical protein